MGATEHFKVRVRKAAPFVSYRSLEVADLTEGARAVIGKRADGSEAVQSMEFDRSVWPHPDAARTWTKSHRDQLEALVPGGDELDLSEDTFQPGALKVDREAGAIRGAKLLGAVSANGHRYSDKALNEAAVHYRAGDGVKVNLDHPDRKSPDSPRRVAERWAKVDPGTVRVEEGAGVFADVKYNPAHPLTESILWFAEQMPDALGFSHNGRGRVVKSGNTLTVESVRFIRHVDLVADPATTSGLFESLGRLAGADRQAVDDDLEEEPVVEGDDGSDLSEGDAMDLSKLDLDELRKTRPDLVASILKEDKDTAAADAELKRIREERDTFKAKADEADAKDALAVKRETADKLIAEAKLPKEAVTDAFLESVLAAKDDDGMKTLVEDRAKLVLNAKPKSRERDLTEGKADTSTSKGFASAVRG